MAEKATTLAQYLKALPEDRRAAIEALRRVINENLGAGFQEGMQYGMPAWFVPHSVYPAGYHCDPKQPLPFVSIAAQKNHIGLYLFCVYADPGEEEHFRTAWLATGRKLDMGKSCVRVKKLDDIPLDVVGGLIRRMTVSKFVAHYESAIGPGRKKAATKKAPSGTTTTKSAAKPATRKAATKKKTATKKKAVRRKAT